MVSHGSPHFPNERAVKTHVSVRVRSIIVTCTLHGVGSDLETVRSEVKG